MAFGVVDFIGLADTAYGLIESLVNHGSAEDFWASFTDSNEAILEKLDGISAQLDDAVLELRQAISAEVEDVQQQSLFSALARAESVRDLLSSGHSNAGVSPGDIIAQSSLAFRDVLVQAKAIVNPAFGTVHAESVILSSFAVSYALAARMEVAARFEMGELSSNKIRRQIDDAASYFEELPGLISQMTDTTAQVAIEKKVEVITRYAGHLNGSAIYGRGEYTYYEVKPSFDFGGALVELPPVSTYDKSVRDDIASRILKLPIELLFAETVKETSSILTIDNTALPDSYSIPLRPGTDTFTADLEDDSGKALARGFFAALIESAAFQQAGLGSDAGLAVELAKKYRTLTDGVELIGFEAAGVSNDERLVGSGGNDLILGKDGDDTLVGNGDSDLLDGGIGNDEIQGGYGEDRLIGGDGDDSLGGGFGDDALLPGAGNDRISGGPGFDVMRIEGPKSDFEIRLSVVLSGAPIVWITSPEGERNVVWDVERVIFDDKTMNIVVGTDGSGSDASDVIQGDFSLVTGTDEAGAKEYQNFPGDDFIFSLGGDDNVLAGAGDDSVYAGEGSDTLAGGIGNDQLFGEGGDDQFLPGTGSNSYDGGEGWDRVVYVADDGPMVTREDVHFAYSFEDKSFVAVGDEFRDVLSDVEVLDFDEDRVLIWSDEEGASSAINVLRYARPELGFGIGIDSLVNAGDGDDQIIGASGNDFIVGGLGDDAISGSRGTGDTAIFSGSSHEYSVTSIYQNWYVEGPDGRDRLTGIEYLQFDDGIFAIERLAEVTAARAASPAETVKIEAEDMEVIAGFRVVENEVASGDAYLQAGVAPEQVARYAFNGTAGTYDLRIGYFDETDGVSHMGLRVNGISVDDWLWDATGGDQIVTPSSSAEHLITGLALTPGHEIELVGQSDGDEPLRTDYLSFTPIDGGLLV